MFDVDANLKHVNTHEYTNWRLVSALLFVCCVMSSLLRRPRLIPCTSHCGSNDLKFSILCLVRLIVIAMFHAHVEPLSSTSPSFSSSSLASSTSLLLFTFLEENRQQPCGLPLRNRVPRTTYSPQRTCADKETKRSASPLPWNTGNRRETDTGNRKGQ